MGLMSIQSSIADGAGGVAVADALSADYPDLIRYVVENVLSKRAEFQRYAGKSARSDLVNFIYATPSEPHAPADIFARLRWGGLFVFASPKRAQVEELAGKMKAAGFEIEDGPSFVKKKWRWLPFFASRVHY